MKFIEVVNAETGRQVLVNLALVSQVRARVDNKFGSAIVLASGETIDTNLSVTEWAFVFRAYGVLSPER